MSKHCPDTNLAFQCSLQGHASIPFPDFTLASLPSLRIRIQAGDDGEGIWVPLYKVEAISASAVESLTPLTAAAAAAAADATSLPIVDDRAISYDAQSTTAGVTAVRIGRLASVALEVGLSPLRDQCSSWRMAPVGGRTLRQNLRSYDGEQFQLGEAFQYTWITTYYGDLENMPNITFNNEYLLVRLTVQDLSNPSAIELPEYTGMYYIFASLPFGFLW
eukprot:CAMPEP_0175076690 /NCGR_PEP_ID=MMETSP0052_2-20121109/22882_1 /TAXON_ID=51329 ORGANISM="Polytomella parva, Strain SAG 63-3" /NCGR_SAMPLE_ID=MMETSP0052_2 /ASSEMBLY_ACC=CAM_ASM_000194 /LENGTH=218 /DNA_ID=CAMNT_0016345887 /DNA_START=1112 /DNA_END=1765 /DNA_ORIENTATION=-